MKYSEIWCGNRSSRKGGGGGSTAEVMLKVRIAVDHERTYRCEKDVFMCLKL